MFRRVKVACMALGFLVLGAGAARAGYRQYNNVVVYSGGSGAYGALGDARNSGSNTTELIGCSNYVNGSQSYCYCVARDKVGNTATCLTSDPTYCSRVAALNGDSYLYFLSDSSGTCNYLNSSNRSDNTPKAL
jgi:hypothetical protein